MPHFINDSKQRIYVMLNYAIIQVISALKQLALSVYIVDCLRTSVHDIMNSTVLSRSFSQSETTLDWLKKNLLTVKLC